MSVLDRITAPAGQKVAKVYVPTSFFYRTPEKVLISAMRLALREYDRATKPDGRRRNGHRVDPSKVQDGMALIRAGMSIRRAARVVGVGFGTLWVAKEKMKASRR